jgi:hypothetical protein
LLAFSRQKKLRRELLLPSSFWNKLRAPSLVEKLILQSMKYIQWWHLRNTRNFAQTLMRHLVPERFADKSAARYFFSPHHYQFYSPFVVLRN